MRKSVRVLLLFLLKIYFFPPYRVFAIKTRRLIIYIYMITFMTRIYGEYMWYARVVLESSSNRRTCSRHS